MAVTNGMNRSFFHVETNFCQMKHIGSILISVFLSHVLKNKYHYVKANYFFFCQLQTIILIKVISHLLRLYKYTSIILLLN